MNDNIRMLIGQLGWSTEQTRPDLAFEVCRLSSIIKRSKVDDILKGNILTSRNYIIKRNDQQNKSLKLLGLRTDIRLGTKYSQNQI